MKKLLLATDAWGKQVNGVVRTLEATCQHLSARGFQTEIIEPSQFKTMACPIYPEIRLSLVRNIGQKIEAIDAEYIHIATEGPIGQAVRNYCVRNGIRFTSSYHTRFPEYLQSAIFLPKAITYRYLRWFHRPSSAVLVPTKTMKEMLEKKGFKNLCVWSRGVDTSLFYPRDHTVPIKSRPVFLYVGRLSQEKGIEDFLSLPFAGTYWVVGDGPQRKKLERKYRRKAIFFGALHGDELARKYANANVFVFPSKSDTFGLVVIEALASGTPVASYPVPGPQDIFSNSDHVGYQSDSLEEAVRMAINNSNRSWCAKFARQYSWEFCTSQFIASLSGLS